MAAEHVERMRAVAEVVTFAPGEMLAEFFARTTHFHYIESCEAEAVDPLTGGRYMTSTLGPSQFAGEIAILSGGRTMMGTRAVTPVRTLAVTCAALFHLMAAIPRDGRKHPRAGGSGDGGRPVPPPDAGPARRSRGRASTMRRPRSTRGSAGARRSWSSSAAIRWAKRRYSCPTMQGTSMCGCAVATLQLPCRTIWSGGWGRAHA